LSIQDELAANPLFLEQLGRPGKRFANRQFLAIGGFPSTLYWDSHRRERKEVVKKR
jgi:hypothetical protein